MGSVERVLVLGIVVVIVAILGIAVWGASDDDANGLEPTATDGGAVVRAPVVQPDGVPQNITPGEAAQPSEPMSDIERLRALREQRRSALAGNTTQQEPGVPTKPDDGNGAAPGTSAPVAEAPAAGGILPLDHATPVSGGASAPVLIDTPKVVEPSKDSIYTVGVGDSLWKIAHKHYGSGDEQAHVDAILAANPTLSSTEFLKVGQKITLPVITTKVDPTRLPAEKQAAETGGRTYVVKEGDTLSAIAKKELGSSKRSNEIFELNRTRLSDPGKIVVGMKLTLPPKN